MFKSLERALGKTYEWT